MLEEEGRERGTNVKAVSTMKLPVGSEIPARPYHGKERSLATTDETPSAPDGRESRSTRAGLKD